METDTVKEVLDILDKEVLSYEVPVVDLIKVQTDDPFKILIATILSARTKDETTAKVAERLFGEVDSFEALKEKSREEIERLIYPAGFYKTKAKNLKMLPDVIDEKFNGSIPETVDELVELPGVGRKTANLVSAIAFSRDAICVDTHVHRISNRLGYVNTKDPFSTEMALRDKLPRQYWQKINRILVAFGQNTCTPVSPFCSKCPVKDRCERKGVVNSR